MIKLIKGFPYDNSYDYIKMFPSKVEQDAYFNSLDYEEIDEHNYIKVENSFNVNYDYDYLVNEGVNYIVFNNGYRDIYAFIIEKQFARKNVTKLIYEVDVIQTYLLNFSVNKSFIERKVCTIDEITDYDEGLYIGEPQVVYDNEVIQKEGKWFMMFNGMREQSLIFDDTGKLTNIIDTPYFASKPQTVIDGITYPLYFVPLEELARYDVLVDHPSLVGVVRFPSCTYVGGDLKIPVISKNADGTYQPYYYLTVIAKTITSVPLESGGISVPKAEITDFFPYTYYVLSDGETEPLIMQPQYLPGSFTVKGKFSLSHQPVERYYPSSYKGDTTGIVYNITNNNQMMLPTATNTGLSYLNANANTMLQTRKAQDFSNMLNAANVVGGAIATGGLSLIGGGVNAFASGVMAIQETDARNKDMMLTPNSISSFGTPSTRQAFNTDNVRVIKYSVSDAIKQKILAFTNRYGNKYNNYNTIDLKTYKGYIKYIAPNIDSTIDNFYIAKIKEILERGVYID